MAEERLTHIILLYAASRNKCSYLHAIGHFCRRNCHIVHTTFHTTRTCRIIVASWGCFCSTAPDHVSEGSAMEQAVPCRLHRTTSSARRQEMLVNLLPLDYRNIRQSKAETLLPTPHLYCPLSPRPNPGSAPPLAHTTREKQ